MGYAVLRNQSPLSQFWWKYRFSNLQRPLATSDNSATYYVFTFELDYRWTYRPRSWSLTTHEMHQRKRRCNHGWECEYLVYTIIIPDTFDNSWLFLGSMKYKPVVPDGRLVHCLYRIFLTISVSCRPSDIMPTHNKLVQDRFIREYEVSLLCRCPMFILLRQMQGASFHFRSQSYYLVRDTIHWLKFIDQTRKKKQSSESNLNFWAARIILPVVEGDLETMELILNQAMQSSLICVCVCGGVNFLFGKNKAISLVTIVFFYNRFALRLHVLCTPSLYNISI